MVFVSGSCVHSNTALSDGQITKSRKVHCLEIIELILFTAVDLPDRIQNRQACREKYQRKECGSDPGVEKDEEIVHNVDAKSERDEPAIYPLFLHGEGDSNEAHQHFDQDRNWLDE
jgi:hypothetical protein